MAKKKKVELTSDKVTRKELIKCCRYYKGEKVCPQFAGSLFWAYEQAWVDIVEREVLQDKEGYDYVNMINDYNAQGLANFNVDDNVPGSLKALLFNRYSHSIPNDVEGFKKWYKQQYLQQKGSA